MLIIEEEHSPLIFALNEPSSEDITVTESYVTGVPVLTTTSEPPSTAPAIPVMIILETDDANEPTFC